MRNKICKKLYKELPTLIVASIVFSPFIAEAFMYVMFYNKVGYLSIGMEVLVSPVVVCISLGAVLVWNRLKSKYSSSVPIAKSKRFTKVNSEGDITINTEDINEIIVYLNEVENYFERRGTAHER